MRRGIVLSRTLSLVDKYAAGLTFQEQPDGYRVYCP